MPKYVYDRDKGIMVDKETGLPMLNQLEQSRPLQTPRVFGDLPGYRSPIDGKWIEGRRARRYDLESNNCIDANEISSAPKGRKFKNRKFAEKRNLTHLLDEGAKDGGS